MHPYAGSVRIHEEAYSAFPWHYSPRSDVWADRCVGIDILLWQARSGMPCCMQECPVSRAFQPGTLSGSILTLIGKKGTAMSARRTSHRLYFIRQERSLPNILLAIRIPRMIKAIYRLQIKNPILNCTISVVSFSF